MKIALIVLCIICLQSCATIKKWWYDGVGDMKGADYELKITNGWNVGYFYFYRYYEDENTYIMFDEDDNIIAVVERPESYTIIIRDNPYKKEDR
jgi:hypothetical protein